MAYLYLQNNNPAEEKGSISGTVVDATSGKPLKSVSVTAIEQNKNSYTKHENVDTTRADGYNPLTSSTTYLISSDDTTEIKELFGW